MKHTLYKYIPLAALCLAFPLQAQETIEADATSYRAEIMGSAATGDNTPFWMTSNRYGIVPLEANNAYLRAGVFHQQHFGKGFRWGAGIDVVAAVPRYKNAYIHQLYAELGYKCLEVSLGSKERYQSLVDASLSSGDMIYSNNARPVPEMNIRIPRFTTIPLTKGWLQFKGNFSVGRSFDTGYLEDWHGDDYTWVKNVLWHHKSLFFQVKDTRGDFPLSAIVGIQHIAQWGGTSTNPNIGEQPHSFKDFLRIITGREGGGNATLSDQINVLGSHHISYDFGLRYETADWSLRGYYQHLSYDKSGMEFYNGTDGLWGLELELPRFSWLDRFVFEYITTRNQSGPFHYIWFDHETHPGRGGGDDNYYNNDEYITGNSYFNRGIGSPLIPSPEYNANHAPGFQNNRVRDFHFGLQGALSSHVRYRLLLTVMNTWGTFRRPFLQKKEGVSLLADITYTHPRLPGWDFSGSLSADTGDVFGDSTTGFSLRIRKRGLLKRWE